ncbi:unnamed protein product [Durusdinium trenchii]|uniref:Uncharacterized protein n=1 Tax=Durusdinium trenchii TaxID=1381693 RepID=A0ABP0HXD6_9DINO
MNPYSMSKPSYGAASGPTNSGPISLVISTVQLALLMLAPWAFFATLTWALMSRWAPRVSCSVFTDASEVHLYHSIRLVVLCFFGSLVVLLMVCAAMCRVQWLRKGGRIGEAEPRYMKKYYSITDLDFYDNVNPARSFGKEMLDAGRVIFTKGSRLDYHRSFAHLGARGVGNRMWQSAVQDDPEKVVAVHQNGSTFCVVPIIAANDQALPATFDFWAAGKDCCGETGAGFACGAAKSAVARGCLTQQMSLGQQASSRAFALLFYILYDLRDMLPLGLSVMLIAVEEYNYRQAVRFAEVGFHLESVHPLFFEWTANPIGDMSVPREEAFAMYFMTNLVFLLGTFLLVVVGYVCFLRAKN